MMDVLNRIKELQKVRGWSNYRLAKKADISQGSLNNMFRLNNFPTISTLEAICKGFGITLSQFFTEEGEAVVLTNRQKEMLKIWDTLSPEQQDALLEFLKKV